MNAPVTPAEFAELGSGLPSTISTSMLDGYLAAVASGPNFVMPDQVLRWVSETGAAGGSSDVEFGTLEQPVADPITRHYQAVNDALNDQTYAPYLADPQAWCRGYMVGFAADMMAWEPLMSAEPQLLKAVMADADEAGLADPARRIHAFWVERRRMGADGGALQGLLAALSPTQLVPSTQPLH